MPANSIEKVYITLKDAANRSSTVTYTDSNDFVQQLNEYWRWWGIDLKKFKDAGTIDFNDVRKLIIGFGNKVSSGGSGTVYFDNIKLTPSACFNHDGDADLNNDCVVNLLDLRIMAQDWLESSYAVTAAAPPTPSTDPNLLVWYKFDEKSGNTAGNSSMYGASYDGSIPWDLWDNTGHDGNGGLLFDGTQRVDVPIAAVAEPNLGGHSTVAFWIKEDAPQLVGAQIFQIGASGQGNIQLWSEWTGDFSYTCGRYPDTGWQDTLFWGRYGFANPQHIVGQWNHYAFTKNHTTGIIRIYHNGYAVAEYKQATAAIMPSLVSGTDYFTIGAWRNIDTVGGYYTGIMDDFRLYNRALSGAEILSLAGGSSITQPILSQANVVADGQVNFKDFAVMAAGWMKNPLLWP
jgi:hypothetical protein